MKTTTRADWKNLKEMPEEVSVFDLNKEITSTEYDQIKLGLTPGSMEDKWFIYVDNDVIHFHRSWVGSCIYQTKIEKLDDKVLLTQTVVNRNPAQYNFDSDEEDKRILSYLIDRLLLGKKVPFPMNNNNEPESHNVLKHNIVGYGRANNE